MNILENLVYTMSNPKSSTPGNVFGVYAKDTINTLSSPIKSAGFSQSGKLCRFLHVKIDFFRIIEKRAWKIKVNEL